ncbi:MAG: aspartyl protease family protein [Henriciella sp.]|nr:aspartyl protease family protein [Henriciella sp.]
MANLLSLRTAAWVIIAYLAMAFAMGANAAEEERTLELQKVEQFRPYTSVVINGIETSALLDTGATIPLISDGYFATDPEPHEDESVARILGVGGQRTYPVASLPHLAVGAKSWTDLRVAVNTENRYPVQLSILPISLFETRVVDFDFSNDRVLLYDGRPKRVRHARRTWVDYQEANDLILVPIKINSVRGLALIDTGADMSFVNPEFAEAAGAKIDEERTALIRGSDLNRNKASVFKFRRLIFADNEMRRFSLPALETDLFSELGYGDQPMMVMGMDLLRNFRLQVDRERRRIYFIHDRTALRASNS